MPTLYEQALVELRARLDALPGLGTAGVMRGDAFTPERTQVPAIDIADGDLVPTPDKCADCWVLKGTPQVRITALSESARDTLLNAAVASFKLPWLGGSGLCRLYIRGVNYRRGGQDKTAFTVVLQLEFSLSCKAFDLSAPS